MRCLQHIKWFSHLGKQFDIFSKEYTELPYDPAMPLLGVYPRDSDRCLHTDARGSITHKSQQVEATQGSSAGEWKTVVRPYSAVLLGHKKG